jgi:hypothetical protein
MAALLEEPGGEAPWLRALKVMKGRLWGWASLFMGAQVGSSTRDFEIWLKGAMKLVHLPVGAL